MVETSLTQRKEEKLFLLILVGLIDGFTKRSVSMADFFACSVNDLTQLYFCNTSANTTFLSIVERAADVHTFSSCFPNKLPAYLRRLRRDALAELKKYKEDRDTGNGVFSAELLMVQFKEANAK